MALEEIEGEAIVAAARRSDPPAVDRSPPVRALPAHLPREEKRIEPEQGTCTCPDCGGALRPLGQDSNEMLDAVPVQWCVVRTIRPKYSCRSCEKIGQTPAPVKAIARIKPVLAYWGWHLFQPWLNWCRPVWGHDPRQVGADRLCLSLGIKLAILSKAVRSIHDRLERLPEP